MARSLSLLLSVVTVGALLLLATRAGAERHVAAGLHHMCVVRPGGAVQCTGDSNFLGNSNRTRAPDGVAFMAVTAGDTFSCGLVTNGSAVCWGELPGDAPDAAATFIDIHAGARHLCGLQADGNLLCYGDPEYNVTIVPPGTYQTVSTGADVACAVARDHTVACWGDGTNPVIATLPAITDADHVSVGYRHACYISTSGGVACWGGNGYGQAAVPAGVNSTTSEVWWLSAGGKSTCAISGLAPPGQLECWGEAAGLWNGTAAYEVACNMWGCIVSEDIGGGAANASYLVTSLAGMPIPRTYNMTRIAGNSRGPSDSVDGIGTNAKFDSPSAMAMQGGALIVTEMGSKVLRRVDLATLNVTTYAGQKYG